MCFFFACDLKKNKTKKSVLYVKLSLYVLSLYAKLSLSLSLSLLETLLQFPPSVASATLRSP